MEENNGNERQEIFSERVRAGKRTYFFDVKATRSNDYYLTITESKRRYKEDGFTYEKHKIFLYKEDFNKFVKALNNTVNHVKEELLPDVDFDQFDREREEKAAREKAARESEASSSEESSSEESSNEASSNEESSNEESSSEVSQNEKPQEEEKIESGIDTELKWE